MNTTPTPGDLSARLPELPFPDHVDAFGDNSYTADQMRAYAIAAFSALPAAGGEWKSPFGNCVCDGANECPGCNPNAAIELAREIAAADERRKHAPCMECGATTAKDAETKCHCSGDKDGCHGCELWPDTTTPQPSAIEEGFSITVTIKDGEWTGTLEEWRGGSRTARLAALACRRQARG